MPESVTDRPTKAHEYVFLLSKSERYCYNAEAVAEASIHEGRVVEYDGTQKMARVDGERQRTTIGGPGGSQRVVVGATRNRRSVWTITTKPYPEAHFATFPPELPEICIKAGCPPGGTVLDPFAGAGTTLYVAKELGRKSVGVEINPTYADLTCKRVAQHVLDLEHTL
jgi:DNA modification methylase